MAAPVFPDSGLVAVALVIRSRDGPRFVFHYPPQPDFHHPKCSFRYGTELDQSELETVDQEEETSDESDLEADFHGLHAKFGRVSLSSKQNSTASLKSNVVVDKFDGDDHYDGPNGEQVVPWEQFGEFSTVDLESILTPKRAFHKQKFELSLDPLIFVAYPIHIREDGFWKKPRKSKRGRKTREEEEAEGGEQSASDKKLNDATSEDGDGGGMTMFLAVFVLRVAKLEEDQRINDIYEHIAKTFNKALKHAQAQSNYVWRESEMILSMKEKAREERSPMSWLWSQILIKSTLANAVKDVYTAISGNGIATVHLGSNPAIDLSLQIPIPSFLTNLPKANERAMPGLHVTTANPFIDDDGNPDGSQLNKHFALLLLGDEDKIIAEIERDNTELSAPLIECIRLAKPTTSFLQVAQTNTVDLQSILILAHHLIYWRKAIAIPPLHGRDTYIISPNCDSRKLPTASVAWKKAFPFAPSLPNFLAQICAAPRPYKSFAPSKAHRSVYMDMLAWLVRGGWVTGLRTFAWILVWPEIIYEVQYQLQQAAVEKTKKVSSGEEIVSPESTDESSPEKTHFNETGPLTTAQIAENARLERVATKAAEKAAAEVDEFGKKPIPVATDHPCVNKAEHLKGIAPYIIVDAHRGSHVESLYIAALGERFTDPKVKECWGRFVKYFNGEEPLESIGLREGMKRKETWNTILQFQEHLLVCKHW